MSQFLKERTWHFASLKLRNVLRSSEPLSPFIRTRCKRARLESSTFISLENKIFLSFCSTVCCSCSQWLPIVLEKVHLPYRASARTAFEIELYFHASTLMSREVGRKNLNNFRKAVNSTTASSLARLVQKTADALTKAYSPGPLQDVIQPYLWFNISVVYYQVLSQRPHGFVSLEEETSLFEAARDLQGPDQEDTTVKNRTPEVDEALCFLSYSMLKNQSKAIYSNWLYSLHVEWPELEASSFRKTFFPPRSQRFQSLVQKF